MVSFSCCVLIVTVIWLIQGNVGLQEVIPTVYSSAGGTATLPCTNVIYPNCSSTTWIYISRENAATAFFEHGKKKSTLNTKIAERLILLPNCSLHITNVTTEDAGPYSCQQYRIKGGGKDDETPLYLNVLNVSAKVETGGHVTLHCLLHTHDNCKASMRNEVTLSWVDEGGSQLRNSTNRWIRTTSVCNSTLTEEFRDPNPVYTRTCQLTAGGKVQLHVTHTTGVEVSTGVLLIAGVASLILLAVASVIVLCKRRSNTGGSKSTPSLSGPSATSIQAAPPPDSSANEQEGSDLQYATFQLPKPTLARTTGPYEDIGISSTTIPSPSDGEKKSNIPLDPNVIYAAVQKKT